MPAHIAISADRIRAFCKNRGVKEMSLFGSVLREDFGPRSDVDFLPIADENAELDLFDRVDMQEEPSRIPGRPAHIATRGSLRPPIDAVRYSKPAR